ncbi:HlyC/CorC family transporter [Candidatus Desantisbacteria bacterium]|nr:HlyC/CorC family transporter [Candidatus Desantisbacteria bacterium]
MLTIAIIGLILLICASAFFSCSEAALFSLDKIKVKQMPQEACIPQLLRDPHRLLAVLLSGTTIVNIAASALGTMIFIHICQKAGISKAIGTSFAIITMTFLILFFGEILPIVMGATRGAKIAPWIAYPVRIFYLLFTPLQVLIVGITGIIVRLIEKHPYFKKDMLVTEEELKTMIDVGGKDGVLDEQERRIIHSIFEFGAVMVKQVMIEREQMVCVDAAAELETILKTIKSHSRVPVFEGIADNIIGMLYARDVIEILQGEHRISQDKIRKLLRTPYYISESLMVNELLKEFQHKKLQIALVRNAEKKIVGIVSMEDLLEEIVGEIHEESPGRMEARWNSG